MKYCFGIDIGGTTIKFGFFNITGNIIDKWEIPTMKDNKGIQIIPDIAKSVNSYIEKNKLTINDILGLGVGVPAPISTEGIVKGSANLRWEYKDVISELNSLTNLTVKTGNDANLAALGELWLGSGKKFNNLVFVTIGTGVGGGVIVDGKPLVGKTGASGEIGHITVNYMEKETCGCGKKGCLEQYASATGIVRITKKILEESNKESILRNTEITAKKVFDAVKENDLLAIEVAKKFGKYLGYALANIAVICDPEIILIGGGVAKAGDILIKYIKKYYDEKAYFANKNVQFKIASLGNDAGICGAAKLILI